MRILIDGQYMALLDGQGPGTYARNLARVLTGAGHEVRALYGRAMPAASDPLLREALFFDVYRARRTFSIDAAAALRSLLPHKGATIPVTDKVIKDHIADTLPDVAGYENINRLFLMGEMRALYLRGMVSITPAEPVEIAHWTAPVPIRAKGAKNVYTVHDLTALKAPYATESSKVFTQRTMRLLKRHADHFIAVSEATKADMVELFDIEESRITVTHQSVKLAPTGSEDDPEQNLIDLDAVSPDIGLKPRGYFLTLAALDPRKNLDRIIEAYLQADVSQPLVLAGKFFLKAKSTHRMLEQAEGRVFFLDYIQPHQATVLLRHARALVFPTLHEGFGLPVLEAMTAGAPVITANLGGAAEVAGDAALLVDPADGAAIREAIREMAAEDAALEDWVTKGAARAGEFADDLILPRIETAYQRALSA
ncbi:MAG: glycosyltransferase family 1 protein [Pseudomonadota bacterium]